MAQSHRDLPILTRPPFPHPHKALVPMIALPMWPLAF